MRFSDYYSRPKTPKLLQTTVKEDIVTEVREDSLLGNIISYLQRKLGIKLVKVPGVEHYKNSSDLGYGIRYIINGTTKCIRLNWHSMNSVGKSTNITSIDYFSGKHRDPDFNIFTQKISLVKALPMLAKVLRNPAIGNFSVFPENEKLALSESVSSQTIMEAKRDDFTAEECIRDFFSKLHSGASFTRSEFTANYHNVHASIFDTMRNNFAKSFDITGAGRIQGIVPGHGSINDLIDNIMARAGVMRVTVGGTKEEQLRTDTEDAIEEQEEHIPFVDTLEHLEGLTSAVCRGAGNALIVAGRGGVGKTQTVEDTLDKLGLQDGAGYFKMTGSASPIGIYTTMYQHRNDILLFDDCDGALSDQDGRNIIKAATDTKKKRKLAWGKKSSFIFDPELEEPEQYADDPSMVPKYFDFTGRVIFISNLPLNKLDPDGALRTRAFIINVNPTDDEVIDYMEKILHKIPLDDGLHLSKEQRIEVFNEVKNANRKNGVSIRKLVRALNIAATGVQNWKVLVKLYS